MGGGSGAGGRAGSIIPAAHADELEALDRRRQVASVLAAIEMWARIHSVREEGIELLPAVIRTNLR